MANIWKRIPWEFPIDGQEVWVRRMDFWDSFSATWDESATEFVIEEGYRIPWYEISRWKVRV